MEYNSTIIIIKIDITMVVIIDGYWPAKPFTDVCFIYIPMYAHITTKP